jgi:hypothetical protein
VPFRRSLSCLILYIPRRRARLGAGQVYIICLYTLGSDMLDPSETVYSENWDLIYLVRFFLRSRDPELRFVVYFNILNM